MPEDPDDEISCVSGDWRTFRATTGLYIPRVNDLYYIISFVILWLFGIYISSENVMNCIDLRIDFVEKEISQWDANVVSQQI